MSEATSVSRATQIGAESLTAKGTAVPALKRLQGTSIEINPKINSSTFTPYGGKFPTITVPGKEWSTLKLTGKGMYTDMAYLLCWILKNVTPVQQGGTAAYKWTWTLRQRLEDIARTFTVEQGSPLTRAARMAYAQLNSLAFKFDRDNIDLDGDGFGQLYTDDIQLSTNEVERITITGSPSGGTFTITYGGQTTAAIAYNATASAVQTALEALSNIEVGDVYVTGGPGPDTPWDIEFRQNLAQTDITPMTTADSFSGGSGPASAVSTPTAGVAPTDIALTPIVPNEIDIYMDDTAAALGNTQLLRVFNGEWNIKNRFGMIWPLQSALTSHGGAIETVPESMLNLWMANDDEGMAPLTAVRAGAKKFIRFKAIGDNIESTYYNTLQIDFCGQCGDINELSDQDGIYGLMWPFRAHYDSTWGKILEIQLTNTLSAL